MDMGADMACGLRARRLDGAELAWSTLEASMSNCRSMHPGVIFGLILASACGGSGNAGLGGPADPGDASIAPGSGAGGGGAIGGGTGGGVGLPSNCQAVPQSLQIAPADQSVTVDPAAGYSQAFVVTATYAGGTTGDVTGDTFLATDDPGVGGFNGNVFTWGGKYGGTVTISATYCGVVATTTLVLKSNVNATVGKGGVDPNAASGQFGGGGASTNPSCSPTLVYPPDGVLLPPNTNVIEVHFLPGGSNHLFEVSFTNSTTNYRLYTSCTGAAPADGMPLNGGCVLELDQADWTTLAQTNRNGEALTVTVRGLGCDGANIASSASRQISIAREDLVGALYYWASMRITVGGGNYNSGGIFRYDFGVRGQKADPVLTPDSPVNSQENNCIGCHSVSRDGRKMIFDFDDNDDDDEYGDVFTDIYDIAAKTVVNPILKHDKGGNKFPPGYHTWNRTTQQFLLSDGPGDTAQPAGAFYRVSEAGMTSGYTKSGTLRGTTPDWAPDDGKVVFASPPDVLVDPPAAGYWQAKAGKADDLWFAGASLYVAPWNAANNTLGDPQALLTSSGQDNYYYPSFSPDGSLIVFNYAPSGANYHNELARVKVISAGQAAPTPADLVRLNDSGPLTNSWARWSPFVQTYQGQKILWITTSSTRNYGLRIVNDGKHNCYAAESPIGPAFTDAQDSCRRSQIWMAAVRLDVAAVEAGQDISWPAFWLPFQDLATNNHLAQWAQRGFEGTCNVDSDCGGGRCCDNGGCTTCPSTKPNCNAGNNCAPGQCCVSGSCGPCGMQDGSLPPPPGGGGCNSCLDCDGQACVDGKCGDCTSSAQCCAPLLCQIMPGQSRGQCVYVAR
jgi:hypothetical protein